MRGLIVIMIVMMISPVLVLVLHQAVRWFHLEGNKGANNSNNNSNDDISCPYPSLGSEMVSPRG